MILVFFRYVNIIPFVTNIEIGLYNKFVEYLNSIFKRLINDLFVKWIMLIYIFKIENLDEKNNVELV